MAARQRTVHQTAKEILRSLLLHGAESSDEAPLEQSSSDGCPEDVGEHSESSRGCMAQTSASINEPLLLFSCCDRRRQRFQLEIMDSATDLLFRRPPLTSSSRLLYNIYLHSIICTNRRIDTLLLNHAVIDGSPKDSWLIHRLRREKSSQWESL